MCPNERGSSAAAPAGGLLRAKGHVNIGDQNQQGTAIWWPPWKIPNFGRRADWRVLVFDRLVVVRRVPTANSDDLLGLGRPGAWRLNDDRSAMGMWDGEGRLTETRGEPLAAIAGALNRGGSRPDLTVWLSNWHVHNMRSFEYIW